MNLLERRRALMKKEKKNWFDFSKVTGGSKNTDYSSFARAYGYVKDDKYIAPLGLRGTTIWLYDSRTLLPKGDYILSFTLYTTIDDSLCCKIGKYLSKTNISVIKNIASYSSVELGVYTDYSVPFTLEEETTIVLSLQGAGNASNYTALNHEFTNIRIEKVG